MAIHIGYDREEDKIELILASQGNVISTLVAISFWIQVSHFDLCYVKALQDWYENESHVTRFL